MFISKQALVMAIVYVLCVVVGLISSIVGKTFSASLAFSMLLTLAFLSLIVYDTHCLTAGNCGIWSWIRTIMYIIIPVIGLILYIFVILGGSKSEQNNDKNMIHSSPAQGVVITRPRTSEM